MERMNEVGAGLIGVLTDEVGASEGNDVGIVLGLLDGCSILR